MKPEIYVIAAIFTVFALLEVCFTHFFRKPNQKNSDGIIEIISTSTLMILTQPMVLFCSASLAQWFVPSAENAFKNLPFWAFFGLFLIFDDMVQYWWHRTAHSVPWLYNLHRPHHNAEYLSIRVVYRNNLFFYALMPAIWFSGVLIFLGGAEVYAVYIVIKLAVICGAHCDVRWDAPLYRIKALSPLMWVVERIISTPATHSAHHGKFAADGVTHYKGNYGNLLFFWDVLFGTAKITRQYPSEFGVENLPETSVGEQLLWPLISAPKTVKARKVST